MNQLNNLFIQIFLVGFLIGLCPAQSTTDPIIDLPLCQPNGVGSQNRIPRDLQANQALCAVSTLKRPRFPQRCFANGSDFDSPMALRRKKLEGNVLTYLMHRGSLVRTLTIKESHPLGLTTDQKVGIFQSAGRKGAIVGTITATAPIDLVICDLNNDGYDDVVTANEETNNISVMLGKKDLQFPTCYQVANAPYELVAGDFNGDGKIDIVVRTKVAYGSFQILMGEGDGTLAPPIATDLPMSDAHLVAGRIGTNRHETLFAGIRGANGEGEILALTLSTSGQFDRTVVARTKREPRAIIMCAASGNKPQELIAIAPTLCIYEIGRNGRFRLQKRSQHTGFSLLSADLDADGHEDLLLLQKDGPLLFLRRMNRQGLGKPQKIRFEDLVQSAVAADLNGDGFPEIYVSCRGSNLDRWSTKVVSLGSPRPGHYPQVEYLLDYPDGYADAFDVADLDGDGLDDVATSNRRDAIITSSSRRKTTMISQYEGASAKNYLRKRETPQPDLKVADIDGDKRPEVCLLEFEGNEIQIFRNRKRGRFNYNAKDDTLSIYGPLHIEIADLNGDALQDIIVSTSMIKSHRTNRLTFRPGRLVVFLGIGKGRFGSPKKFGIGISPQRFAMGDLNEDGNLDVIVADSGEDIVGVLDGTDAGIFKKMRKTKLDRNQLTTYSSRVAIVAVSDIDIDGHLDVIAGGGYNGEVRILFGDGHGHFRASRESFDLGFTPFDWDFGDLNADGIIDMVAVSSDLGLTAVLLGQESGKFKLVSYHGGFGKPRRVQICDMNSDERPDLVISCQYPKSAGVVVLHQY